MAAFVYKALDASGQFVTGELQAPSMSAAARQLIELGYVPLATSPATSALPPKADIRPAVRVVR